MKRLFVLGVAVALALSMAPAAKADFVVGMMAYTDVGYFQQNDDRVRQQLGVDTEVGDVFLDMPNHSRLYSKCTTEECGGYFELGVGSDAAVTGVGFQNTNFRKLYGWYDFGPFRIEAGHTEPLGAARFNPTQLFGLGRALHIILIGWGNIYDRTAQVNIIFQGGPLYLAAGLSDDSPWGIFGDGVEHQWIPRVHIQGGVNTANFSLLPNLTFQQGEGEDTSNEDSSVFGWVIEIPLKIQAGILGATVSAHYGENVGNVYSRYYQLSYIGQNATGKVQLTANGATEDTTCWGGYFDVSFGGKPVAIHLIGGINHVENDLWSNDDDNTRYAGVIRLSYSVTANFSLSPEFGYYVFGDDVNVAEGVEKDLGSEWLLGVQFQFVF